jgi:hypothetical protein
MAEYLPIYKPGQALTLKASAAITGGQLVAVSGSGTVAPAGAASASWVGVAAFDAGTNDNLTIHSSGVQALTASGAVTAGDQVVSAAGGQVSTGTPASSGAFVGIALTTAANGAKVRVKFAR